MRRYEGYQVDRSIETWVRSNMTMIVYCTALVIELCLAYVMLSNIEAGTTKTILYAIFFLAISYTVTCIGLIAGGRADIASKMGAKL